MNDEEYAAHHGLLDLVGDQGAVPSDPLYGTVDPLVTAPFAFDLADAVRLHRLILDRKVTTVLEFGCGFSTIIMAHALAINRERHGEYVAANLRRSNAFEIQAVDDVFRYVDATNDRLRDAFGDRGGASVALAQVHMTTFAGRVCTEYSWLPNICPDLIYLDGPSQHSVHGDVGGIHTRHPDRLPMACDLLKLEWLLLPGTMIVVDGRTANARFLRANFQRAWTYSHDVAEDVHTFELCESPLGKLNEKQIRFCLGDEWLGVRVDPKTRRVVT
jgi:hypothetical protein